MTLKGHASFRPKLNPAFQISPIEIGQFVSSVWKGSNFQILLFSFLWKVNYLKRHAKFGPKLNPAFQINPPKIGQFVSSVRKGSQFQILLLSFLWKVSCLKQKAFTGFFFEGPCNVWSKIELCYPNKPKKIGKFVSSGQKGSKFQILILSFVWRVNCLNQKHSE